MFKEKDPLALAQEIAAGSSADLDKELALADGKAPEAAPEKVVADKAKEPLKITPAGEKQEKSARAEKEKTAPLTQEKFDSVLNTARFAEDLKGEKKDESDLAKSSNSLQPESIWEEVYGRHKAAEAARVSSEDGAIDGNNENQSVIDSEKNKITDPLKQKSEAWERVSEELRSGARVADSLAEKPGSTRESDIELTREMEVASEAEKEAKIEVEKALDKAREDYVAAMLAKEKAEKGENKLTGIRARIKEFFVSGISSYEGDKTRLPARNEKISGAQAEAEEARTKLKEANQSLREALKNYRNEEIGNIDKKAAELRAFGRSEEEIKQIIEKEAEVVLHATSMREAAKIDSLKTDKQIEQMGTARKYVNEKAEQFVDWYKNQPTKTKIAVSVGLGLGGAAGALMGLTTVVSLAMAGQIGLRVLGSAMTTGGLSKAMESSREKLADKKISKEFAGNYLETLKKQGDELNDKIFERLDARKNEKVGRFILAGTMGALVGGGALAQGVKNGFNTEFGQAMTGKLRSMADGAIDWAKKPFVGDVKMPLPGSDAAPHEAIAPSGGAKAAEAVQGLKNSTTSGEAINPLAGAKVTEEIQNLKIGARGPEGAIIDNFKAKPELAKAFGWDGKADIKEWAGTKAHQLWLKSVGEELAKPGMAEKLTAQGFTADAEGYAKAMHKIGKGFVQIAPTGEVQLTDDTSFLKNIVQSVEDKQKIEIIGPDTIPEAPAETPAVPEMPVAKTPEIPAGETPVAKILTPEAPVADPLLGADGPRLKEVVNRLVEPEVLKDATFKAGAKVPLGKILAEIPPEAYEDKYALSRYWHSLSESGVHTPDLPGTGFMKDLSYDDFRKYSEMAKFLRENAGTGAAEKLKDMTVEDFLKTYGSDLGKGVKGQVGGNLSSVIENAPSAKINILSEQAPGVKVNLSETEAALVKDFNEGHFVGEGGQELAPSGKINLPEPTPGAKINLPEPVKIAGAEKAMEAIAVAPEKQAIIKGIIESRPSTSAADLVSSVKAGKVSVEDVANYYAQNIKNTNAPAATVSPRIMENLKKAFSAAANGDRKALRGIEIGLERLRQGK